MQVGGRWLRTKDLWAICKTGLNPTKLRRQRPNIQLFPQTRKCWGHIPANVANTNDMGIIILQKRLVVQEWREENKNFWRRVSCMKMSGRLYGLDGEWVDGWMDGWSVVISCWLFYNQFPVLKHFLQCPTFALDVSDHDWLQDQV